MDHYLLLKRDFSCPLAISKLTTSFLLICHYLWTAVAAVLQMTLPCFTYSIPQITTFRLDGLDGLIYFQPSKTENAAEKTVFSSWLFPFPCVLIELELLKCALLLSHHIKIEVFYQHHKINISILPCFTFLFSKVIQMVHFLSLCSLSKYIFRTQIEYFFEAVNLT